MTKSETNLLLAIHAETLRVESLRDCRLENDDPNEWARRIGAIDDWRAGYGIRVQGDWIGRSPADRQSRRRMLERLERDGLVELHIPRGRARTHVSLTDQGQILAEAYRGARRRILGLEVLETDPLAAVTG